MSKERERLAFEWQESSNQYIIFLTLIIAIISFESILPNWLKIPSYWILAVTITLFGLSSVDLTANRLVYKLKLRDERRQFSKISKYWTIFVYLIEGLVGLGIIFLGGYLLSILSGLIHNPI